MSPVTSLELSWTEREAVCADGDQNRPGETADQMVFDGGMWVFAK